MPTTNRSPYSAANMVLGRFMQALRQGQGLQGPQAQMGPQGPAGQMGPPVNWPERARAPMTEMPYSPANMALGNMMQALQQTQGPPSPYRPGNLDQPIGLGSPRPSWQMGQMGSPAPPPEDSNDPRTWKPLGIAGTTPYDFNALPTIQPSPPRPEDPSDPRTWRTKIAGTTPYNFGPAPPPVGLGEIASFARDRFRDRQQQIAAQGVSPETEAEAAGMVAGVPEEFAASNRGRELDQQINAARATQRAVGLRGGTLVPNLVEPGLRRRTDFDAPAHPPEERLALLQQTALSPGAKEQITARDPKLEALIQRRMTERALGGTGEPGYAPPSDERRQSALDKLKSREGYGIAPTAAQTMRQAMARYQRAGNLAERRIQAAQFATGRRMGRLLRMGEPVPMPSMGGDNFTNMAMMSGNPQMIQAAIAQRKNQSDAEFARSELEQRGTLAEKQSEQQARQFAQTFGLKEGELRFLGEDMALKRSAEENRNFAALQELKNQGLATQAQVAAYQNQAAEAAARGKREERELGWQETSGTENIYLNTLSQALERGVPYTAAVRTAEQSRGRVSPQGQPGAGSPTDNIIPILPQGDDIEPVLESLMGYYPELTSNPEQARAARQAMLQSGYSTEALTKYRGKIDPETHSLIRKALSPGFIENVGPANYLTRKALGIFGGGYEDPTDAAARQRKIAAIKALISAQ